jgi:hypothetical protein
MIFLQMEQYQIPEYFIMDGVTLSYSHQCILVQPEIHLLYNTNGMLKSGNLGS